MSKIVESFERPSKELVEKFKDIPSALAHDVLDKGIRGVMSPEIKPIFDEMRVCGTAFTVDCHVGDNLTLHKAIEMAEPGDVLVVDGKGFEQAAFWGEIATTAAMAQNIAGLVIDGSVRDVVRIRERGFPVFTKSISVRGAAKNVLGNINTTITCGGITVNPGDIVIGDRDSVVVVPLSEAERVYQEAVQKEEGEADIMEALEAGETTMDLLGLREKVAEQWE